MPYSTTSCLNASTQSVLIAPEDADEIEMTHQDGAIEDAAENEITNQDVEVEDDIIFMDPKWFLAAANGDTRVLQECNDFYNKQTPKRNTILHVAAQFDQAKCVAWILSRCPSLLQQPNEEGDTPLHLAAREGHLAVAKVLIPEAGDQERGNAGEFLGMTNKAQNTALHEAVINHHPQVVGFLIKRQPHYEYVANKEGKTPLYIAAEQGFGDLVKMIIDMCSSPAHSAITGRTALHAAIFLNDPAMTKKILEWKSDLTEKLDEKGWSPLHLAAYVGCAPEIVRQLLKKCKPRVVYLGLKSHGNRTALHIAAGRGHVDIVKELLSRFPDCCEKVDDKGNNVLHLIMPKKILVSSGLSNIRWLRVKGLMTQKNAEGETPLHLLQHSSSSSPPVQTMSSFITSIWSTLKSKWSGSSTRVVIMSSQEIEEDSLKIKEDSEGSKSKESEKEISRIQKIMKTHMVVAALIATVTFTAGFTPPGGYIQSGSDNEGKAVLLFPSKNIMQPSLSGIIISHNTSELFKYFVAADSTALVLSVCAIGVYFYASLSKRDEHIMKFHLFYGTALTVAAMAAMLIAFVLAMKAMTDSSPVTSVGTIAFACLLLVPWFLKAPSPLICMRGPKASSWGRKQTKNFILFSVLYGVCLFIVFGTLLGWAVAFGFPMLLFTFLLHDYL